MKRIGWIVSIGLLLVISGFYYFRFSNTDSSKEKIEDGLTIMDSKEMPASPSEENLSKDSSIGVESVSSPNESNEIEKSAITSPDNKSSKRNRDTLNLRDFGVVGNGNNETVGFQKALNASVGKVLFIPKQQGKYYLTRQLRIPSNSKLVFDSNVIIQATDDLEQDHANFEVLLRIENANNVNIQANNALFRMNKSFYKGEHNHIFMINGSSQVLINKARANSSGGDGFYIGAYKSNKKFCEDITITNSIADDNRRQGLSVISVKNLLVKQCQFNNTSGASPASGVDIEPNNNGDFLQNINFVNCVANNNQRRGFMVQLSKITKQDKKIDITFNNCSAKGNIYGFASMYFDDNAQGLVQFVNCKVSNSKYAGFVEESCSSVGVMKKYIKCIASNNNVSGSSSINSNSSNFYIYDSGKKNRNSIGNSVFENCISISESGKIKNGISVLSNGRAVPRNIEVSGFSLEGVHRSKVSIPDNKVMKSNNILIK